MTDHFGPVLNSSYWGEYDTLPLPRTPYLFNSFNMPSHRLHKAAYTMGDAVLENLAGSDTQSLNPWVNIHPSVNSVAPYELPGSVLAVDEEILTVTALASGEDPFAEQDTPLTNWQRAVDIDNRSKKWPIVRRIAGQSISEFIRESTVKKAVNQDISNGFTIRPAFNLHTTINSGHGLSYFRGIHILSVATGWPKRQPDLVRLRKLKFDGQNITSAQAEIAHSSTNPNGNSNSLIDILGVFGYDIDPMIVGETVRYMSETLPRYTLRRIVRVEVLKSGVREKHTVTNVAKNSALRMIN